MSLNHHISSTQIVWVAGLLIGSVLALVIGSAIGHQDFSKVIVIVGVGLGGSLMLFLGRNYWILIPFALAASRLPTVPMGGRAVELPELAITACSVMFFLRLATRKEKLIIWRPANIPILLFIAWVGMVFVMNPVGLAAMGSSLGGGRFYLKLLLASAAFFILSSRTYSERDIRWVIVFIIFGAVFSLFYEIVSHALIGPTIDATTGMINDEFYTWHQALSIPAITIVFLIFARFSPREVFTLRRSLLVVLYFFCFLMVLVSGKRMAMASIFLPLVLGAILHRQFVYIFVATALAAAGLAFVTAGQGQWFNLPLVAQRTISWLPGDWDPELQGMTGGADDWRTELRLWAAETAKSNPWIGRGFAIDISETAGAISAIQRGGDMSIQVAGAALGRSWHNTWFGYAADFGIPLAVIQAALYSMMLLLTYRCLRYYTTSSVFGVFAMYLLMFTVRDLVASHTSGHSALDAWYRWWLYGIMISIYYAVPKREKPVPSQFSASGLKDKPTLAIASSPLNRLPISRG